jgi:polysaccharide pyruvyl transferase WcaK-like protein
MVQLETEPCDHTLRLTTRFLRDNYGLRDEGMARAVLDWLRSRGGDCDCEAVNNVAFPQIGLKIHHRQVAPLDEPPEEAS